MMFAVMRRGQWGIPIFEKADRFFQVLAGVNEDEQSDADGKNRINKGKISESHDNGTC